jgi:tRNA(Ile)-lysidine synthase
MADLLTKLRRTCARFGLIPPGVKVLVAASGGADSTALLHALVRVAAEQGDFSLEVAHLDHGLRGAESAEDARFVARMAAGLGLPCHLERLEPGELRRKGVSVQEAAREARLAWLERVARKVGAERIALGHTADDRAEEVLMHLLSGAGTRGLAGVSPARGRLIRPLIECTRAEVEAWLRSQAIPWREDSSNRDLRYLRNRVRLELIPEVEARYNPSLREALLRQAQILGDEDELLGELAAGRLGTLARAEGWDICVPCAGLAAEHPAIQRRLVRLALERLAGSGRGLTFRHVEAVRALARSASASGSLKLPGGLLAERRYGDLLLKKCQAGPREDYEHRLPGPGSYGIPEAGRGLTLRVVEARRAAEGEVLFDLGSLSWPLVIRNPRRGDRFQPRGMAGHKKVFRLLADCKVPRGERWRVPLLLSAGRIIWVCGLRAAEFAKPSERGPFLSARIEPAPAC